MEKPSVESVRKFLKDFGHDGWSILEPGALSKGYGFPKEWDAALVYNHKSGSDYKSTITSDKTGKRVSSMKGIHVLTVLSRLAGEFDANAPTCFFGRGRQASAYTEAIWKVIGR